MGSALMDTPVEEQQGDPLRDALVAAVGDDYEVVRLIGRGGMGAVYLARDRALERLVAIKVLPPGSATDAGVLERFRREAKTVASLQHAGIVPLYAFGERRGLCWFVMGYVRGESLAARLERETMLDADAARTLLAQVADALDHAHRQGIVHRDIKPDNVLIDDDTGRAMLTDFGIARADTLQAGTSLTQAGSVLGTPHYMSPEQATAEPTIDGRSDLYSVGVMGYQMLSGRLPFAGTSFRELLMQHVSATPVPLSQVAPSVPADVADAVMRCLEKDPAKRFSDGRSLRTAIGGAAVDAESLTYELAELRHSVAYLLVTVVLSATLAWCAALRGGTLLSVPAWVWLLPPLYFLGYGLQVRAARKLGYDWATITRVVTQPPRWWFLWWPRAWRRAGDVYDQLPAALKLVRAMVPVITALLLLEAPLMAWATDPRQLEIRDRIPSVHAFFEMNWVARLGLLVPLVGMSAFLLVMVVVAVVSEVFSRRATRGYDVGYMDRRRLSYKPTDSAFWRDPRIQRLYRTRAADRRPRTPQEFVSQILASVGTLPPSVSEGGSSAASAARRLLDAMQAHERELALLEKAAPREQLERLEAEIVVHESEAGDPEAVALLVSQRDALARSRERMAVVGARRDAAAARLEALWASVRKLATTTDGDAARALTQAISDTWRDVEHDYPLRRATGGTQRNTGARLGMLAAASLSATVMLHTAAPTGDAEALLARGQPDSALTILATADAGDVQVHLLTARAELQRGGRPGIMSRVTAARRAQLAYTRALALDSTNADALEAMAWMTRLLPGMIGGDRRASARFQQRLARTSPYRATLLAGHFARVDGQTAIADTTFARLVRAYPDSARAWFARFDLAFTQRNADVAHEALQRYAALMPADRTVHFHRGKLAAALGADLAGGEAGLREYLKGPFVRTQPQRGESWWRLGQVLRKQGRHAEARQAFQQAVAVDPKDRDYRAALDSLDVAMARPR